MGSRLFIVLVLLNLNVKQTLQSEKYNCDMHYKTPVTFHDLNIGGNVGGQQG